jgi:hypothetical protein
MVSATKPAQSARWAFVVWGAFILVAIVLNGTVPFATGVDMHAWTFSPVKAVLFYLVCYAVIFMIVPLILVKGRAVLKPTFLIPMVVTTVGITIRPVVWPNTLWPTSLLTMPCLIYLDRRFDLSQLGFRSKGWSGDGVSIVLIGLLSLGTVFLPRPSQLHFAFGSAVVAALDRLFLNPASSVESLFYFGFLEERILQKCGKWLTPHLDWSHVYSA